VGDATSVLVHFEYEIANVTTVVKSLRTMQVYFKLKKRSSAASDDFLSEGSHEPSTLPLEREEARGFGSDVKPPFNYRQQSPSCDVRNYRRYFNSKALFNVGLSHNFDARNMLKVMHKMEASTPFYEETDVGKPRKLSLCDSQNCALPKEKSAKIISFVQ
jgi:hypothetical protein